MKKATMLKGDKAYYPVPNICPTCKDISYCLGSAQSFVCPHCGKTFEYTDKDYQQVKYESANWMMFFIQHFVFYLGSMLIMVTTSIYFCIILKVPYLFNAIFSTALGLVWLWFYIKYVNRKVEVGINRQLQTKKISL